MYTATIAKIEKNTKIWAGFNMLSELLLLGDLERQVKYYGGTFEPVDKGELKIIEVEWAGFIVMIQYRRIN